jgi:TrmH family RNA methyltransferase
MISSNRIKFIKSLQQKKVRDAEKLFVAEGEKLIREARQAGASPLELYATERLHSNFPRAEEVTDKEMGRMSSLKSAPGVLGVFAQQQLGKENARRILALEDISDPGNLGTLMRAALAFDVEEIWCTSNSVECYNPKVVQASMGAIFHLPVRYGSLADEVRQAGLPTFAAVMEGTSLYKTQIPDTYILMLGSESHGLSGPLLELANHRLAIPMSETTESLNIAMAGSIILSYFRQGVSGQ